jgi:two-component system, sensor histidine kinase
MSASSIVTSIFIGLGAIVMTLAIFSTRRILALVKDSHYATSWQTLFFLMMLFAVGYIAAIILIVTNITSILVALTGIIFMFGALFVYVVVRVGLLTINELVDIQKNIAFARDQAEEASRFKTELIGRVSHELRTPLHAILGYTDMLQSDLYGDLNEQQRLTTGRIFTNTQKLITDINGLLDQAQIESGRLYIRTEPFHPVDLLNHVENILELMVSEKNLRLETHLDPALPEVIIGDLSRLQDILTNLAQNAVKFTEQGVITVEAVREGENNWKIQVRDTGIGIAKDIQLTVFEPFKQVDGTITRKYGGVGLGLALVRQLVDYMEGEITVESEPGQGSTFTVCLPLTTPEDSTS